jgi:outer membrane protein assembly factor BamB
MLAFNPNDMKHSVNRYTIAALFTFTLLAYAPALSANSFQGCPMHQGRYIGNAPKDISSPAWPFKAGEAITSSAVCDGEKVYFGSDDRHLYALDAQTGELKWKYATGGKIRSTPAVAEGSVVFGSYDGFVYSISADTGVLQWKFQTGGERHFEAKGLHGAKPSSQTIPDVWDCYASSASIAAGTVYIGSGDGCLYALDAKSGDWQWKFQPGEVVHGSPALWDGKVYVGAGTHTCTPLMQGAGRRSGVSRLARTRRITTARHTVLSHDIQWDSVFGCRDFDFYALDATSGELKWKSNLTWVNASPASGDGKWCITEAPYRPFSPAAMLPAARKC